MKRFLQKNKLLLLLSITAFSFNLSAQTDVTNLLINPSFETGDRTGWTWIGADGYGWLGPNTDGDVTKNGSYVCGIWNGSIGDSECSQSLTGLPNGYYKITGLVTVSSARLTNQRLFASSAVKTTSQLYGAYPHPAYSTANMTILGTTETFTYGGFTESTAENGPFRKLSVISHVTDGNLKLGVRVSGKSNAFGYDYSYSTKGDAGFFKFDYFTLTEVSNVATLDNITLSSGNLDIAFNSSTTTYTAILPVGTTTVTPTAFPSIEGAVITGTGAVNVSSGTGQSVISVTSLDGTVTKNYTINYTVLTLSNDATLSTLSVNLGVLYPEFNPAVTSYKVLVPVGTASATVSAVKNDNKASLTGDGLVNLINGKATVNVVVTAENNDKKTYTIYIDQNYIVNPGFETGDFTGWNWTGTNGYAWVGVGADADETKTGINVAGAWNATFGDVELSQTITNLPNATYQVTVDLMGSSNNTTSRLTTQRLFANNKSMLFGSESNYSAENLSVLGATETYSFGGYSETVSDRGPFKTLTVFVPVTDGTLTLGIRTNGKSSALGYTFPNLTSSNGHGWFKVDNLTITYYAPNTGTLVQNPNANVSYILINKELQVYGVNAYSVFDLHGIKLAHVANNTSGVKVSLTSGIYIVKTSEAKVIKLIVK